MQRLKKFTLIGFLLLVSFQAVSAAGSWHDDWADAPDWGYQNWANYSTTIKWSPTFMWSSNPVPTSDRRIELEFYDPANGNHCDRLEPTTLVESGGDWIDGWNTDDECGGGDHERLTFWLKEHNISASTYYQAQATATKLYTAGYGGETNVSWTCWLCSDDWLGKQSYTSSYADSGSSP